MRRIAELAETETDSRRFLEEALREIAALPWMNGARWRSPDDNVENGWSASGAQPKRSSNERALARSPSS